MPGARKQARADQTVRICMANTQVLKRSDVVARFMQGYRDAIDWMYADPAALGIYETFSNVRHELMAKVRDQYFPKATLWPDEVRGLDLVLSDALKNKFITRPITPAEVRDMIQDSGADVGWAKARQAVGQPRGAQARFAHPKRLHARGGEFQKGRAGPGPKEEPCEASAYFSHSLLYLRPAAPAWAGKGPRLGSQRGLWDTGVAGRQRAGIFQNGLGLRSCTSGGASPSRR
jgi:hypothetical protein